MTTFRIGQGYDTHRLVEGRPLVLGGVKIPHNKGSLGHSDGDVLIHSIIDAMLGALGLGDIGRHFPPSDERYKGANSLDMLAQVKGIITQEGYLIGNIDSTIILETPKLAPHIDAMKASLAEVLNIPASSISIKAKTAEGLGPVGEGRSLSCHAIALMYFS
ncbi:MAG: 2-C-methyl-D-erythritol 2,4-cyclodiphosphate synthase [Cyanobacteria bacterium SZAS TMP-1]|nr:2-C-methyl-D-erythritol 2,4-cyclodiphosphate synthase [Cyanobacteria bacterium SZAS TMP-1]